MQENKKILTPDEISKHKETLVAERTKLGLMQEERKGLRDRLTTDFQQNFSKFFSEDEIEALESAPASKALEIMFEKFVPYVDEALAVKDAEILEFEREVGSNESNLEKMSDTASFFADNPDLDQEAFDAFLDSELPNSKIREIQSTPTVREGFEMALNLFNEAKGTGTDVKDVELPLDVDDIAGATGDILNDENTDASDVEYARQIGLG